MKSLILPYLEVQRANAMQSWWLMGPPSPFTVYGFVHALSLFTGVAIDSYSVVLHSMEPLGRFQQGKSGYGVRADRAGRDKSWDVRFAMREFLPQQFQGASFFDKKDHIGSGFSKGLQPTASAHVCLSIIAHVDPEADLRELADQAEKFLRSARLGGGEIIDHAPISLVDNHHALRKAVPTGFAVTDRSDMAAKWMREHPGDGGVEAVMGVLSTNTMNAALERVKPAEKNVPAKFEMTEDGASESSQATWLSANVIGYAFLEQPRPRGRVRDGLHHAYAEPMVGLVQYLPMRSCHALSQIPSWRYRADDALGVVYVCAY